MGKQTPVSMKSILLIGSMLGILFGVVAGAYDVIFRAPRLCADFVGVVNLYYAAIGGGLGIVLAMALALIRRIICWPATLRQIATLFTGMGLYLFAMLIFDRNVTLLSIPCSMLISLYILQGWPRISWRTSIAWWLLAICSAVALGLSRVTGILPQGHFVNRVICVVVLTMVMTLGRRASEWKQTPMIIICSLGLLILSSWSLFTFQQPIRNSPNSPHHRGVGYPNVVLIVMDTLRQDYLGVYGHTGGLTPNLDRFAAESTIYEDAFSTAPWTVPSHGSMFTGYFPKTHGTSSEDHLWLDDDLLVLPEALQAQNFQTVSITANGTIEFANFAQGFDQHYYLRHPKSNISLRLTPLLQQLGFPSRWMDKGSAASVVELGNWFQHQYNSKKPFFLFVNVMEPHQPYQPPIQQRNAHLPPGRSQLDAVRLATHDFDGLAWLARQEDDPQRIELARAMYAAEVAYQDKQVGQMIKLLGDWVDLDETMIIVTSDHGENLGEAKRWVHLFALNDYLLHVPLMIRYPNLFPAARRMQGLCQLTDLIPTIFDVLDVPYPIENLPGKSIVPATFKPADAIFAQWWPHQWGLREIMGALGRQSLLTSWTSYQRTIRTQDYKYIWSSDSQHGLYDVKHDRDEAFNIIAQEPEIARQLDQRLWKWWRSQPDYHHPQAQDSSPLDAKSIEMLKSIGYIGD